MHNNFLGNTFDVVTNGGRSYNAFLENHWSTYQGYDLNRDVIGDVPYRPVRLFAQTVENYPQAIILLRSPLEQFMEYAERILPIFTPKAIEDDRPFMRELQWLPSTP
jgi:nitrous oxidase accessory protein